MGRGKKLGGGDFGLRWVEEVPEPHAGAGRVRIRAEAASVNPVDGKFRAGYMAEYIPVEFPASPGNGAVDDIGDGVSGCRSAIAPSVPPC